MIAGAPAGNSLRRKAFKQMDQRVDDDRRSETTSGREDKGAGSTGAKLPLRERLARRRGLVIFVAVATAVVILAIFLWWLHARKYESTDDAFIDARTVQISAQIGAAIVDVPVND